MTCGRNEATEDEVLKAARSWGVVEGRDGTGVHVYKSDDGKFDTPVMWEYASGKVGRGADAVDWADGHWLSLAVCP